MGEIPSPVLSHLRIFAHLRLTSPLSISGGPKRHYVESVEGAAGTSARHRRFLEDDMRFSESGSFAMPPEAFGWLLRHRVEEEQPAAEPLPTPGEIAAEFTRLVEAHPDFVLAPPASAHQVCFRAAPDGLDEIALNRLNLELQQRVNASGELELGRYQLRDRYFLRVEAEAIATARSSVARAWEVIGDAFVGILVESDDPRMRWRFGTDTLPLQ